MVGVPAVDLKKFSMVACLLQSGAHRGFMCLMVASIVADELELDLIWGLAFLIWQFALTRMSLRLVGLR